MLCPLFSKIYSFSGLLFYTTSCILHEEPSFIKKKQQKNHKKPFHPIMGKLGTPASGCAVEDLESIVCMAKCEPCLARQEGVFTLK